MNFSSVSGICQFLRIVYGLYWGIIGVDKFFGFVTESEFRVSKLTLSFIPLSLPQLLRVIGTLEIAIAVMILTQWPRLGAICGIILMTAIIVNLIAMKEHYDIALHGITIGAGMLAFYFLLGLASSKN